jgi:hypothetical protein
MNTRARSIVETWNGMADQLRATLPPGTNCSINNLRQSGARELVDDIYEVVRPSNASAQVFGNPNDNRCVNWYHNGVTITIYAKATVDEHPLAGDPPIHTPQEVNEAVQPLAKIKAEDLLQDHAVQLLSKEL